MDMLLTANSSSSCFLQKPFTSSPGYLTAIPYESSLLPFQQSPPRFTSEITHPEKRAMSTTSSSQQQQQQQQQQQSQQQEQQQQKRLRTSVACSRCRKRKIKCSGESEDGLGCESCRHSGHARHCMFTRVKSTSLPWSENDIQCSEASSRGLSHMSHQSSHSQSDHGYGYSIPMRSQSQLSSEVYSNPSSVYATPSMTRGACSPSSSTESHLDENKPQALDFPARQVITLPVPPPGRQPINSMSASVTTNHFPRKDGAIQYYDPATYLQSGEYATNRAMPSLEELASRDGHAPYVSPSGSSRTSFSRKQSEQYECYDGQRYGPAPSQ